MSKLLAIRSRLNRDIFTLLFKNAIGQFSLFLVLPIIARLYTPSAIGRFGLFMSFIGIFAPVATLNYHSAIVVAKSERQAVIDVMVAMVACLLTCIVSTGIVSVFLTTGWLGFSYLPFYVLPFVFLTLLIFGFYQALRNFHIKYENYDDAAKASLFQNVGRASGQVVFGFINPIFFSLVAGDLVGRLIGLSKLFTAFALRIKQHASSICFNDLKYQAINNKAFPLFSAPSSLINSFALNLPVPLLALFFGIKVAALYTIAERAIVLPASLIGNSFGDVFFARSAKIFGRKPKHLKLLFIRTIKQLTGIGIIPAILISLVMGQLSGAVFGAHWHEVGDYIIAIMPLCFVQFVIAPVSSVVFVVNGQRYKLIYDVFAVLSVLAAFLLGHVFHLGPLYTVSLVSLLRVLAYLVYASVLYYLVTAVKYA